MVKRISTPLLALAGSVLILIALQQLTPTLQNYPYDGKLDWIIARGWWQGIDPYTPKELKRVGLDSLGHPPTTGFYALPLASLEMRAITRPVGIAVIALLFAELLLLAFEVGVPAAPWTALALLSALLFAPFMRYHLSLAQISQLIGFAYACAWLLARRGRDTAAGAVLGFACTLKLFPGLLVVMMLLARRWRAVIAAGVVYLAVVAIMTSRFGWQSWPEYWSAQGLMTDFWIGHLSNATLQGIAIRLVRPSCKGATWRDPVATRIALAASLLLVAWGLAMCRRALRRRELIDLPYAIFALLSLLTNAFFWEHYNAILILPIVVAGVALYRARRAGLERWKMLVGLAVLAVVVCSLCQPPNNARGWFGMMRAGRVSHVVLHIFEILNWLPTPLLLGMNGALLYWFERRGYRGLLPFAIDER